MAFSHGPVASLALAALLGVGVQALNVGRTTLSDYRDAAEDYGSRSADAQCEEMEIETPCLRLLAFDRPASLQRILTQLNKLDYGEDSGRVDLVISIDQPEDDASSVTWANRQKSVEVAKAFSFSAGPKTVQERTKHEGLVNQWRNAWNPLLDNREACVILEDDTLPSKYAWKWMKNALAAYRGYHHHFGSLAWQRPTLVAAATPDSKRRHEDFGSMPPETKGDPYLYKLFATWGFVALRDSWTGFLVEMKAEFKARICPIVKHKGLPIMPTIYCQRTPGQVWSIWYIAYMSRRQLFTLYANLPSGTTLCSNFREPGLHSQARKPADFPVLEHATPADEDALARFPPLRQLRVFDWDAHQIHVDPSAPNPKYRIACAETNTTKA